SLNYTFVTIATQRPNQWIFVVDTVNIPDNEYEFYAKVKYGAELYETKPIKVSIKNPKLLETSVTNITNNNEKVVQVEDATREFLPFSDKALSLNSSERDVMAVTAELIEDNHLALNDLLAKYSVAKQSGDKILIFTAEGNLNDFRSSLVNTTLQNAQLKDLADDIDQEIEMYLDLLKAKINIFEDIRKAKSNGESARDIDGDGVSDFDEIYIYKTNPNLVDTDNDGFNDGVEIIQGFDPNNGQSEAVLEFESPKDTKLLIRKDVLRIDSVIPLVYKDETVEVQSKVKSEIYGTALPLSFVNLYIFSSPTVVTIKTDADGSFVYTYDKELEDGRHDVYVAITDNTGSIIAQSEPFSFVKEAQAFTPIDKRETSMVTSDITPVTTSSYNVVFGLAVLSLGIILLMLGMGLKTKEDVIIATEAKTVKGGATTEPSF
ncbi:hypothetical protein KC730_00420, partial [Candidatus Kaiserbacteria bacterium]|nr:hypothetical protein [Candidatus Kaiserbacteria bacterium]